MKTHSLLWIRSLRHTRAASRCVSLKMLNPNPHLSQSTILSIVSATTLAVYHTWHKWLDVIWHIQHDYIWLYNCISHFRPSFLPLQPFSLALAHHLRWLSSGTGSGCLVDSFGSYWHKCDMMMVYQTLLEALDNKNMFISQVLHVFVLSNQASREMTAYDSKWYKQSMNWIQTYSNRRWNTWKQTSHGHRFATHECTNWGQNIPGQITFSFPFLDSSSSSMFSAV